jgi:two-component system sensor histidine kinase YesM
MHHQTEIETFTAELNYILAYSLGKIDKETTIRTEVKMLQAYLRLQKMRYDFQAEVEVEDGEYLDTPTARMILQPIAENALHHGLGEDGCLSIRVSRSDVRNDISIILEDNGRGLTAKELDSIKQTLKKSSSEENKSNGIGLRYVHYMLESFYGDKAIIDIESELTKGTRVTLLLPIDPDKSVNLNSQ